MTSDRDGRRRIQELQEDDRIEELRTALRRAPVEKDDFLHKGKVVGPTWLEGIFLTRLNIGVAVLAVGVIIFIIWLVMKARENPNAGKDEFNLIITVLRSLG